MKRGTEITRNQVQLDERAWVFLRNISPSQSCAWRTVEFVNSGKTPALNFSVQAGFAAVPKGHLPDVAERKNPSRGIIAPGGTFSSCIGDKSIDNGDWSKSDLLVRGTLTYDDVFGYSHWTKFCYQRAANGGFSACETGNEMDQNGISRELEK